MRTPKFTAKILASDPGEAPTQKDNTIGVNIAGRKLTVSLWAETNPLGQDSFRLDVDHRGYRTPTLDITDVGDGNWVLNLHDDTGAKYQVSVPAERSRTYPEPPCRDGCDQTLFQGSDRTMRCRGCHLHPDQCNCLTVATLGIQPMLTLTGSNPHPC